MLSNITFSYGHGIVENKESVRFICEVDVNGGKQAALVRWQGSGNPWSIYLMEWMPVRLAMFDEPSICTFALGGDGTIGFGSGNYIEENINDSITGPKGRGPLKELHKIGNHLYSAGMGRQFYKRLGENNWKTLEPQQILELGLIDGCGFTSIDGVDESDIWAVGYKGEIWNRKDRKWRQIVSPTNVTLHKIRMITSNLGYASGKKGVILRYQNGCWEAMSNIIGAEDIWGLEWFEGKLYAASSENLYVLTDDDIFKPLHIPKLSSFGHLHAADGVLWSFGAMQLCWSADAQHWQEETPVI